MMYKVAQYELKKWEDDLSSAKQEEERERESGGRGRGVGEGRKTGER